MGVQSKIKCITKMILETIKIFTTFEIINTMTNKKQSKYINYLTIYFLLRIKYFINVSFMHYYLDKIINYFDTQSRYAHVSLYFKNKCHYLIYYNKEPKYIIARTIDYAEQYKNENKLSNINNNMILSCILSISGINIAHIIRRYATNNILWVVMVMNDIKVTNATQILIKRVNNMNIQNKMHVYEEVMNNTINDI